MSGRLVDVYLVAGKVKDIHETFKYDSYDYMISLADAKELFRTIPKCEEEPEVILLDIKATEKYTLSKILACIGKELPNYRATMLDPTSLKLWRD